jgi:hypothetical protein
MRPPFLAAIAALISLVAPASAATLKVNLDKSLQDNFLGVNGIYHAFAFMPDEVSRGMNDADRAREFDRVRRMGLKIARTWYRPDWTCGDSLDKPFDWRSPKMEAFYRCALRDAAQPRRGRYPGCLVVSNGQAPRPRDS